METELLLNIMENLANGNIPGVVAAIAVVVGLMIYQFKDLRKKSEENHKEIKTTITNMETTFQGKIDKVELKQEKSQERIERKIDKMESEVKEINQTVFFMANKIYPYNQENNTLEETEETKNEKSN